MQRYNIYIHPDTKQLTTDRGNDGPWVTHKDAEKALKYERDRAKAAIMRNKWLEQEAIEAKEAGIRLILDRNGKLRRETGEPVPVKRGK